MNSWPMQTVFHNMLSALMLQEQVPCVCLSACVPVGVPVCQWVCRRFPRVTVGVSVVVHHWPSSHKVSAFTWNDNQTMRLKCIAIFTGDILLSVLWRTYFANQPVFDVFLDCCKESPCDWCWSVVALFRCCRVAVFRWAAVCDRCVSCLQSTSAMLDVCESLLGIVSRPVYRVHQ